MSKRVIVQIVAFDSTGDTAHRMRWPGQQIALQNRDWLVINVDAGAAERFIWAEHADLLVIYQTHDVDLIPTIKRRKSLGLKTLVEYNDNFYEPPSASPVFAEWSSPILQQIYEEFIRVSDGVIVTTENLGKRLERETSCRYFPLSNHFPAELDSLENLEKSKLTSLNFGWAGSLGHAPDILSIVPAIRSVLETVPESEFHFMGNSELAENLQLDPKRVQFKGWGGIIEYLNFIKSIKIGIIPIINTPYNECRSDIKAIEMIGCGVLPILPKASTYKEIIDATGIPTWNSWDELKELVVAFLNDDQRRQEQLKVCYDYVKEKRVLVRNRQRTELYNSIIGDTRPVSFNWPKDAGFIELKGTRSPGPLYTEVITLAGTQIKNNQIEAAIETLQKGIEENGSAADLKLALCKVYFEFGRIEKGIKELEEGIKIFPKDLRFLIEGIKRDFTGMYAGILLSKLKNLSYASRQVFEIDLAESVNKLIDSKMIDVTLAKEFEALFPKSNAIKAHLAELHYYNGDLDKAQEIFSELAQEAIARSAPVLPYSYSASFAEALEAQKKRSLGW